MKYNEAKKIRARHELPCSVEELLPYERVEFLWVSDSGEGKNYYPHGNTVFTFHYLAGINCKVVRTLASGHVLYGWVAVPKGVCL